MDKTITVQSDDPQRPTQTLSISGMVENVVTVNPKTIRLVGAAGTRIEGRISIVPEEKYAFRITDVRAKEGKHIRLSLNEIRKDSVAQYVLTVADESRNPGRYFDLIYLKTDSPIRPELVINVYGNILAPDPKKSS